MNYCPICTHRMVDLVVNTNITGWDNLHVGDWCPVCGFLSFGKMHRPMYLSEISVDKLLKYATKPPTTNQG